MKRPRYSEAHIIYSSRHAQSGTPVGDICRELGSNEATFYVRRKKIAHLGVRELPRLRQIEEEEH